MNTRACCPSTLLQLNFNTSASSLLQQINQILLPLPLSFRILKTLRFRDVMITTFKTCVRAIKPCTTSLLSHNVEETCNISHAGWRTSFVHYLTISPISSVRPHASLDPHAPSKKWRASREWWGRSLRAWAHEAISPTTPAMILWGAQKELKPLISNDPGLRVAPKFAARSASLLWIRRTWKKSILRKERARILIFLIRCRRCIWLGREFSAMAWITILESPKTVSSTIPWFLAIKSPCQRARASAILLVSEPSPEENLVSSCPSKVKRTPPPLPPLPELYCWCAFSSFDFTRSRSPSKMVSIAIALFFLNSFLAAGFGGLFGAM